MLIKNLFKSAWKQRSTAQDRMQSPTDLSPGSVVTREGEALLNEGDALFEQGRFLEAEAMYRQALGSDAPAERTHRKLQRAVAQNARAYDAPGALLVPPGDGSATPVSADQLHGMLTAVNTELAKAPDAMPSKFWESHASKHIEMLIKFGIQNFKRTVAHNYYNWLTVSVHDLQIRRLLELWPLHGSSEALADKMEDLTRPTGLPQVTALTSVDAMRFYRLGVSLLWDYTLFTDHHGLLRKLAEPVTGNPLRIMRGNRLLSQDLAHSVRERNFILDATGLPPTTPKPIMIAELGAGHGRLAHMFAMSTHCRYAVFDIAPALLVSQWYIQNLFPNEKIFTFRPFDSFDEIAEELSECKFAFFASSQLEKFPDNHFDLFINVCSLMEMRVESINYFFREIERTTRKFFYTKQWLIQNNREDNVVIEREDYPVPRSWKLQMDGIDPINQRLYEEVWEIA